MKAGGGTKVRLKRRDQTGCQGSTGTQASALWGLGKRIRTRIHTRTAALVLNGAHQSTQGEAEAVRQKAGGGGARLVFFWLSRVVAVSSEMTETGSSAIAKELDAPASPLAKPDVLPSAMSTSLASDSVPALGSFDAGPRPNVLSAGWLRAIEPPFVHSTARTWTWTSNQNTYWYFHKRLTQYSTLGASSITHKYSTWV